MIPGPIFIMLCSLLGAWIEGKADANSALANTSIEHKFSLIARSAIATVLSSVVIVLMEAPFWKMIFLMGISYGSFTPFFRWTMNKERKLSWWYMDDLDTNGNRYDEMWWRLRLFLGGHKWRGLSEKEWQAMVKDGLAEKYERQVARLAYGIETITLVSFIVLWFTIGIKTSYI